MLRKTEKEASKAERVLEYLERAFEENPPREIQDYAQVLLLLISAFDARQYIRTGGNLKPYEFLKELLQQVGKSGV